MAGTTTTTWLTQEAFDLLKTEYDYLSGPGFQYLGTTHRTTRRGAHPCSLQGRRFL